MANLPYTNSAIQADAMLAEGAQRLNMPYRQRLASDDFDDVDLELGELAPRDDECGDLGQRALSATREQPPPYAVHDSETTKRSSGTNYRPSHLEDEPEPAHDRFDTTRPITNHRPAATPQELLNVRDMMLAYRAQANSIPLEPTFHSGEGVTVRDSTKASASLPKRKSRSPNTTATTTKRPRSAKRCCRSLICPGLILLVLLILAGGILGIYFNIGKPHLENSTLGSTNGTATDTNTFPRIGVRQAPFPLAVATIPTSSCFGCLAAAASKTSGAADVWAMVPGWAKVIGPLFVLQMVFFLFL